MKWNKYTLKTTTEAIDFVSGIMIELGIGGIQVEDNVPLSQADKEAMYIDYLPVLPEDDGTAFVSFYTEEGENDEALLDEIREKLKSAAEFIDVGEGTIEKDITEDIDWVNNWKQFFKSFTVGEFYIKPTWEETEEKYKDLKMIEIDPGTAFGTGKHETTQLCINQLIKYVKEGDSVLDLGCGSGILSIVARKLGADRIVMTDIDEAAITASKENFEVNNISTDNTWLYDGNILDDKKLQDDVGYDKYDIVVANILADVIVPLAGMVDKQLKEDGVFISSGIIYMKEEEVVNAVKANENLELIGVVNQGDWRAVLARKVSK